jgi:hypothetical protein
MVHALETDGVTHMRVRIDSTGFSPLQQIDKVKKDTSVLIRFGATFASVGRIGLNKMVHALETDGVTHMRVRIDSKLMLLDNHGTQSKLNTDGHSGLDKIERWIVLRVAIRRC